jgi:glycosyltransferase involved in cell wall biosynthesis
MRLAFIVSHPIQYYVPIYRGLAERIRQADERPKDEELTGLKGEELERPKDERLGDEKSWRPNTDDCQLTADDSARISALKVFYTWRDAGPARDVRFEKTFAWDIPLMEGYDFEVVPNTSSDPGTHHRQGLINPDLVERVKAWKPDAVHITGYNYVSHGQAIKELSKAGIPVIFRGDSHLLDGLGSWWKWWIKKSWLSRVYSRPQGFAYVGQNNRDYYRAFGVPERKLFHVPHTIEVGRFAEPHEELESKALAWRRELGIPDDHFVFLYAAKLEPRKRPMELLEAFLAADLPKTTLLFVGSGELEEALRERVNTGHGWGKIDADGVRAAAPTGLGGECSRRGTPGARKASSERTDDGQPSPVQREETGRRSDQPILSSANSAHRVVFLPFQNQSAMPLVYRLGDALVLPSGHGETWGLAVNEAQACGRPSLVSDCVGCARDIVREGENGMIFRTDDWEDCVRVMRKITDSEWRSKRETIRAGAWGFDTARGVDALLSGLRKI